MSAEKDGGSVASDPSDRLTQVLVVANRLPVCRVGDAGDQWQPSPGGLVSAPAPALRGRRIPGSDGPAMLVRRPL